MPDIYQTLIRPLLFQGLRADPEDLHQRALGLLAGLSAPPSATKVPSLALLPGLQRWLAQTFSYSSDRLSQRLWEQTFANPLGLAAGFDKDGLGARAWPLLGFGFAELGTVTLHPQPGNPRPRLFRLPSDQAVLNRMGFNNQGSEQLAARLHQYWPSGRSQIPLGINLGKSKVTPLESAAEDYRESFRWLKTWGDYFVVNVSSPNTPGLRSLQGRAQLAPILAALQAENTEAKPLLVKIAPDLAWEDIADIVDLAQEQGLAGIIATNTTIDRTGLSTPRLSTGLTPAEEAGGISGAPLRQRSTEVIRFIYRHSQGALPIIGVGGIFTADDAWDKITAGASLVQIYTGWIYEGPWMVPRLLAGLVDKLDDQGLTQITDAIGIHS
ncbi:quinone-dependent dihydroorotate dehydrogenase [Leptolyngbya sp. PCC 6406]|uniref:quinone-dependent dihydroorotate dehydrogenase n=1 Tax=Leptolyngbya sp. PCC 6406 TaxID=1173264 RepID=UPI0002E71EC4|nr:quinone-dependent dihydroorotate dehydrogenase [Leptolyngbya sp. PCC 6406]